MIYVVTLSPMGGLVQSTWLRLRALQLVTLGLPVLFALSPASAGAVESPSPISLHTLHGAGVGVVTKAAATHPIATHAAGEGPSGTRRLSSELGQQATEQKTPHPSDAFSSRLGPYQNPILKGNHPDPHVSQKPDGQYTLVGTNTQYGLQESDPVFQMYHSEDLVDWKEHAYVFPPGKQPKWAYKDFWAPEIHRFGDTHVVYFAARDRETDQLCLGVAYTKDPTLKDWVTPDKPFLRLHGMGVIDPTHFQDNDGTHYLLYKTDGNDPKVNQSTVIYVQELSPDGLSLTSEPHPILKNDINTWEGVNVEGPAVLYRNGYYYLFYSGNMFNTHAHGIGVARARSLLAPMEQWEKMPHPILASGNGWLGLGHGSIVERKGHFYYVYHAWRDGKIGEENGSAREALMDKIHFTEDGWVKINDGKPSSTPMPKP